MLWLIVVLVLAIPILAIVLDSQLGRALAARLERDGGGAREEGLLGTRVAALEAEVERLSRDIERVTEESSFVRKLLENRPESKSTALPPGEGEG